MIGQAYAVNMRNLTLFPMGPFIYVKIVIVGGFITSRRDPRQAALETRELLNERDQAP